VSNSAEIFLAEKITKHAATKALKKISSRTPHYMQESNPEEHIAKYIVHEL
jgi:hypothetical protein